MLLPISKSVFNVCHFYQLHHVPPVYMSSVIVSVILSTWSPHLFSHTVFSSTLLTGLAFPSYFWYYDNWKRLNKS